MTATFDEPIDPATVTTSTVTLRAEGSGSDVPASVAYNAATATVTLDPASDLTGNTQYTVTLAGSIADTSGNTLGSSVTWTFTTLAVASSFTDTTAVDFGAGTTGAKTYVSETADGEVIAGAHGWCRVLGREPARGLVLNGLGVG